MSLLVKENLNDFEENKPEQTQFDAEEGIEKILALNTELKELESKYNHFMKQYHKEGINLENDIDIASNSVEYPDINNESVNEPPRNGFFAKVANKFKSLF
mgnify:CR=1 FL=1